ncbi:indole-3-glycerol phosphate synthase TrpC [Staphylospora marina]|uniref:indole-3-glycerol phosphate synthase TrpC n=1 Tax=Staphylospora marina TaxID=2490858 RepID=UPI000F5B8A58|nr:indole-3-glycerol phosphate synthase TrpC [Staphylospora marina]
MYLERILEGKREEIRRLRQVYRGEYFRKRVISFEPARSLRKAVERHVGMPLIAEIKPASPSKGTIRKDVLPEVRAVQYREGGAAAVSVLTERQFFHGAPEWLMRVRRVVELPVLRKDFILDPVQLVESRWLGADAVLLIASILEPGELRSLVHQARELGLETLVEIHEEGELPAALAAGPDLIGINNRDLSTFETDLSVTERLLPLVPPGIPVIGESGIASPDDVVRLRRAGVSGVLVGECLMRQEDPVTAVRELIGAGVDCAG